MTTDELSKLFRDAMDWGRSYGQRLNNSYELLDEVAGQFADKARAIEAALKEREAGLEEVRGIWATPDHHAPIKQFADSLKRAGEGKK